MNILQAKEEVKNTVKAYLKRNASGKYKIPSIRQRPILLMGPPGIGKTQIMEQIARECRIGLVSYTITHHTRQSAVGLPLIREEVFEGKSYSVTEYTMSEIIASVYHRIRDFGQKEGILFIDEINCVSETLMPTMLQFLQCKTFGNQKVPEGWIIVAAGNPPEYNKSVREFDMVTLDRVRYINIEADYGVWKTYARNQHIHGAIMSYLELRPRNFYKVEADVDGLQFVTARGWEDLSSLIKMYEELQIPVTEEIIHEYIRNADIAQDVTAFYDLYNKYRDDYGIKNILAGNVETGIYQRLLNAPFDERISVVGLLLDGLGIGFNDAYTQKQITDQWYHFLKQYKQALEQGMKSNESDGRLIYEHMLNDFKLQFETDQKNGLISKEEEVVFNLLIDHLGQAEFDGIDLNDTGKAFDAARKPFTTQTDGLEKINKAVHTQLEHAFDFIEDAFSSGQELLVFVTELTLRREAASYLGENLCKRYLKYNEELLAGSRKTELLKEMER